jgi:ABC transport system ATP-binding/permease protein
MAELALEVEGRIVPLAGCALIRIGRADEADITVTSGLVSRFHLELECDGGHWLWRDLDTLNGTYVNGSAAPAGEYAPLRVGARFMLGDPVLGAAVRVVDLGQPGQTATDDGVTRIGTKRSLFDSSASMSGRNPSGGNGVITIGRASDNSLILNDPVVSGHHARLTPLGSDRFRVEDLRSTNGTFVNGAQITSEVIERGAVVSVGKVFLKLTSNGLEQIALEPSAARDQDVSLSVSGVSFSVATNRAEQDAGEGEWKSLLDDVTFSIPTRSLLAVIGPSGAGKTTLLRAMTGEVRPEQGQVLFNGLDMSVFAGSLADRVGLVPQEDVVHRELTARQALDYAARLRFHDNATTAEREEAVDWVIAELGLGDHADIRIANLSGGQRKRVNTAMELLTKPDLLFLDEPTSGLDPNLDREVMELLRGLAHGTLQSPAGRTVVVVTHSTDNLDKADNVLLLAPGGKVAYFGPPQHLQSYFAQQHGGRSTWADIYGAISQEPCRAQEVFAASPKAPQPMPILTCQGHEAPKAPTKRLLPQIHTLVNRQARLLLGDRALVLFTLALPVVVGLLTLAVGAANGFSPAAVAKSTGQPRVLLVVVIFGAVLMGLIPAVRQLVSERPIFLREAKVGVRPSAYLAAKTLLLGVVCVVQSALLVSVVLLVNKHPDVGISLSIWLELFAVVVAVSWSSAALGLLLSAVVRTSEQVMPVMVVVLMFQLVMCGGVFNVTAPGINQLSFAAPSRWGLAAGAASLDFNWNITCRAQVLAKQQEDDEVNKKAQEAMDTANKEAADQARAVGLPEPTAKVAEVRHTSVNCATVADQDVLWSHTSTTWWVDMFMVALWFSVYTGCTWYVLRRRIQ